MSEIGEESAKEIIGNLLSSPHYEEESELIVTQRPSEDAARDYPTRDRNRKLTMKGMKFRKENTGISQRCGVQKIVKANQKNRFKY